jgi:hypothetical protein
MEISGFSDGDAGIALRGVGACSKNNDKLVVKTGKILRLVLSKNLLCKNGFFEGKRPTNQGVASVVYDTKHKNRTDY